MFLFVFLCVFGWGGVREVVGEGGGGGDGGKGRG